MTNIMIVSGFLGAGKTTFIKSLLTHFENLSDIVIIENDFGDINLDAGIIGDDQVQIETFQSGCICCSLLGDFKQGLSSIIKNNKPKWLIIEPSGVGKVSDILDSIQTLDDSLKVRLHQVITLVDGAKAEVYLENFTEFFEDQISNANTIILTRALYPHLPLKAHQNLLFWKEEKLSQENFQLILNPLQLTDSKDLEFDFIHLNKKAHNHHTPIGHHHHCDYGCHEHHLDHHHDDECQCHSHDADDLFMSLTIHQLPLLSLAKWQEKMSILDHMHNILRCKGIIPTYEGHYIIQYTPNQLSMIPTHLEDIGLVFIGSPFDQSSLIKHFKKENE